MAEKLTAEDWQVISSALATHAGVSAAEARETQNKEMRMFFGARAVGAERVKQRVYAHRAALSQVEQGSKG